MIGSKAEEASNMESQTSSSVDLKPGDLVEIHRPLYKHWGVYVGRGFIVHLTAPDGISSAGSASVMSSACKRAVVKKQKLDVVAGKFSWNIGNYLDKKYPPRPAQVIVKKALELVGQTVPYGISKKNCEHFANEMRYGKKESGQVKTLKTVFIGVAAVAGTLIIGPLAALPAIPALIWLHRQS